MPKQKTKDRVSYDFTLILSGRTEITEEIHDALCTAGCDDALFGSRCGVIYLDFTRAAGSLREAITSAIADVARSGTGLEVVRIEPDELVTAAEIARRIGQSRESVRLYVLGQRGPGGFPSPLTGASQKTPLYRWSDVACWVGRKAAGHKVAVGSKSFDFPSSPTDVRTIGAVNAALELGRYVCDHDEARAILQEVWAGARFQDHRH